MPRTEHSSDVATKERVEVEWPKDYKVILHNDQVTTMEFVVMLLKKVFKKDEATSYQIMMSVHKNGTGIAGIYTEDIARTKANLGMSLAQNQGFPLKITVEEN